MTILIAGLMATTALAVLIVLFVSVQILQKHYSKALSSDIKTQSAQLENTQDLNKILTIQNQLNSLPALHDQKPTATRLFGYLKQFTPAKASIASLDIDFEAQTISVTGSADAISTINTFVDTLKFTTYKTDDNKTGNAFSNVVLTTFGRDDKGASYQLNLKYDPVIFASGGSPVLVVPPGKITTRSETEKPDALFQPLSNQQGTKQ